MRYDTGHKQKTRERILHVAAREVRTVGPQQVGVAAVMQEAGLTHGGFYAHFPSKDALVAASIGHMFDEALTLAAKRMRGVTPAAGLAAYLDAYLSTAHCNARGRGCPLVALAADLPRLPEASREAFAAGQRRLIQALAAAMEQVGYAEPQALAQSVLAELAGTVSLARCETDEQRVNVMLADARRLLKARLGLEQS
ncbi:TetR/AcrR family transcriptional regulator [Achromobacter seleniivolatilans]|uniref:TetR/AcrR family transcriptional regulator n=1 Tax=Achromobacter seleniivolatilans TaxID=3047478 RepID=A0ABY9M4D0_9BURK|nr:TetR/AcrR family transcriptional regulator [Achromobacter sp. R39]WMD21655.1 TetR/AcrR family transcriptional regulator [Achromobacter sp. R39]